MNVLIVSRQIKQVLGFVFGQRDAATLAEAWTDVPQDWQERSVFTDHWRAYGRFFKPSQHTACDKGTGLTSIVEALNTKWRQRQSGLVRRSCGVSWRIVDDLFERFLILVDQHNRQQAQRWYAINNSTQIIP